MKQLVQTTIASLLVFGLVSLGPSSPAAAKDCVGVSMANSVEVEGTRLVLNGMGIREATILQVDVYVAGLYLENKSPDASTIINSEQKKRLVMEFVRDVERKKVHEAFKESLKTNGMTGAKVSELLRMVPAAKKGTKLTLTYIPGKGTVVHVGRSEKGVIEGADFAKAWLKIYVGPRPPNPGLKTGLLGGTCG